MYCRRCRAGIDADGRADLGGPLSRVIWGLVDMAMQAQQRLVLHDPSVQRYAPCVAPMLIHIQHAVRRRVCDKNAWPAERRYRRQIVFDTRQPIQVIDRRFDRSIVR